MQNQALIQGATQNCMYLTLGAGTCMMNEGCIIFAATSHFADRIFCCRASQLQDLGFEPDDEKAEWLRWFNEAKLYKATQGHSCPGPLTSGASFVLTNW